MCVISTAAVASALSTVGLTSMAASEVAVGATALAANAALGAGMGAGTTAITGGNNYALGIGLGAVGGALGSGLGMAAEGIDVIAASANPVASTAGQTVNTVMNAELAEMGFTGMNASKGGVEMGEVTAEFGKDAGSWLAAGGSVAAGLATGTLSGVSAYRSAQAQADAQEAESAQSRMAADLARVNAANARTKAGLEMEAGEREAQDKARVARQERGSGLAQLAGQGVMVEGRDESVSASYEADQRSEAAYDQAKVMQNAEMRAWGYMTEATAREMEALGGEYASASLRSQARSTRRNGLTSSIAGGIAQGLTTGISAASLLI